MAADIHLRMAHCTRLARGVACRISLIMEAQQRHLGYKGERFAGDKRGRLADVLAHPAARRTDEVLRYRRPHVAA
jgi:hypothetical protein